MKKNNILKVVLITIAVTVLLTWLLPTATFSSELTIGDRAQMGLFDIFNYPTVALQYFFQILLYALAAVPFGNRAADKSILVSSNILIVHYLLRAYLILTPSRHLQI